jgi:hypothetical protein
MAGDEETTRLASAVRAISTRAVSNRRNDRVLRDGSDT